MADFRARQRVQIHDGTDEFGVLQTKPIFVGISDGTELANVNASNQLEVSVENTVTIQDGGNVISIDDGGSSITVDGAVTVSAADLDIRDLDQSQDSVAIWTNTAKDGTGTDYQPIVDADGHLQVDVLSGGGGTDYNEDDATPATIVAPSLLLERDDALSTLTPVEGDWAGPRVNARGALWVELDLTNDVTIADGGNSITVDDGGTSLTVDATDLDIRDLTSASDSVEVLQTTHDNLNANANLQVGDADVSSSNPVPVSKDGSANSETNPIFVKLTDTSVSGVEIQDYDTATAVAKDATDNHDYTVANTTFFLKSVIASSSGAMKIEIQTGPVASLVTKAVVFTSGAKPTEQVIFDPPIEVPSTSTGTVRVIRRNDDNQAMDVYSTIIGNDV